MQLLSSLLSWMTADGQLQAHSQLHTTVQLNCLCLLSIRIHQVISTSPCEAEGEKVYKLALMCCQLVLRPVVCLSSLSLFLFLSLYLSLSLTFSLYLSLFLSLSHFISLSLVSLSLSLSLYLSLPLSLSLSLSLSLPSALIFPTPLLSTLLSMSCKIE